MSKYTKQSILQEALKYKTRKDFETKSNKFYQASLRSEYHTEACKHMEYQEIQWTKQKIKDIISTCSTINEFKTKHINAYAVCRRYGMLEYARSKLSSRTYWNLDNFNKEIKKHKTIYELIAANGSAYKWALRNKIKINLPKKEIKKNIIYTPEVIAAIAKEYNTREEFKNGNGSAANRARKLGIFDEVCDHMIRGPYGFDPQKPGILYYLRVTNDLYKIGITNHSVEYRYKNSTKDRENMIVIKQWEFEDGYKCAVAEKEILKDFSYAKYTGDPVLELNGNTELFKYDILGEDNA